MNSHSQAGQDLFVFLMTEEKTDGYYVDLGCNDASFNSNTFALEQIGWDGLLVDVVSGCENRKGRFVKSDAANPSDSLRIAYCQLPCVVDYLSLDVDDNLMPTFNSLPWDRVTFRIITLEHDAYRKGPGDRDQTRTMLQAMGYHLVCADVMVEYPELFPFEDWWVYPHLINPGLIKRFQCERELWRNIVCK